MTESNLLFFFKYKKWRETAENTDSLFTVDQQFSGLVVGHRLFILYLLVT